MTLNVRGLVAALLLTATPWPGPAMSARGQSEFNTLKAVDHGIMSGGRMVIRATFEEPLDENPRVFRTYYPSRNIVLDFPGTGSELENERRELDYRGVAAIEVTHVKDVTRMTVALDEPRALGITLRGSELWLTLTPVVLPDPAPSQLLPANL